MTLQDDDLFDSVSNTEPEGTDIIEPTPEEIAASEFDAGLANVTGESEKELEPAPVKKHLLDGVDIDDILAKVDRISEIESKLTKLHDTTHGTLGQFRQSLDDFGKTRASAGSLKIDGSAFKKVAEYFEDDSLSEALAEDLMAIMGGSSSGQDIESIIASKLENFSNEQEKKMLSAFHPDWEEMARSDEFAEWRKTLKPEASKILDETWDSVTLIKAFNRFNDWRSKKQEAEQAKANRLEGAIMPTGNGRQSMGAGEDYFNQGVKKVLEQRIR